MRNRAFTLVELLVVIAVVVVLMALMSVGISYAMKQAQLAKCMNNMRQMGMAIQQYGGENNFQLPSAVADANYASWLMAYDVDYDSEGLKSGSLLRAAKDPRIFICPAAEGAFDPAVNDLVAPRHTYTMNAALSRKPMTVGTGMESKIVLMVEESVGEQGTLLRPPDGGGKAHYGAFEKSDTVGRWHPHGSTVVLYLDLHVDAVTFESGAKAGDQVFDPKNPEGIRAEKMAATLP